MGTMDSSMPAGGSSFQGSWRQIARASSGAHNSADADMVIAAAAAGMGVKVAANAPPTSRMQ